MFGFLSPKIISSNLILSAEANIEARLEYIILLAVSNMYPLVIHPINVDFKSSISRVRVVVEVVVEYILLLKGGVGGKSEFLLSSL